MRNCCRLSVVYSGTLIDDYITPLLAQSRAAVSHGLASSNLRQSSGHCVCRGYNRVHYLYNRSMVVNRTGRVERKSVTRCSTHMQKLPIRVFRYTFSRRYHESLHQRYRYPASDDGSEYSADVLHSAVTIIVGSCLQC